MKARLLSIAFLLSATGTGIIWLSLHGVLLRLFEALHRLLPADGPERLTLTRVQLSIPYLLGLDLIVLSVLTYLVLYVTVGRPLRDTEVLIEQLGRTDSTPAEARTSGPLLNRIQRALSKTTEALQRERALTQEQLSALREKNQRIAQAQTERVAAERLVTVGRLAAGVAHEVGNPLSGILGYVSIARTRAKDPQLVEFLDRIDSEVQRIDTIVRGLLDLGRPTAAALGPVDLAVVVETCARLVTAGAEFKGVTLHQDVPPGALVRAESGPLSQVFINLLLNAAQAMEGQGDIYVRARSQGTTWVLEVDDTGPGIPEPVMERLFEPFFTTKAGHKGTGLGLAVALHLVEQMEGQLVVENLPKGGARFAVLLSAVSPPALP